MPHSRNILLTAAWLLAGVPMALAQPDPSGIDFVTVDALNNPARADPDVNNTITGRGRVSYEYRLGRTEVTTAQWPAAAVCREVTS